MAEATVQINPEDLADHLSEARETTEKRLVVLDPEKNITVTLGVPVIDAAAGDLRIVTPDDPHIFMTHHLWVNDATHKDVYLRNVPTLLAHGVRDENLWKFKNGQPAAETIEEFNAYAQRNQLPGVQFAVVCNKDGGIDPEVRIGDISADYPVVQAVGEEVSVGTDGRASIDANGKVTLVVSVKGEFLGLGALIAENQAAQEIKILP